ncbi:MAG: class I SAM-dependent methyltransferase [Ignavibacteria bacterium]|nr:class I SAM-dependent methyltransferase [Ignavibacteria bacterium]
MLKSFRNTLCYLSYLIKRKSIHGIHSPFVFDFAKDVLHDKKHYQAYKSILKARKAMLTNNNLIETVDFGTGSGNKDFHTYRIKIAELSKKRMHPYKYNKLLFRIVQYFKPKTILEFGTSTGASTISLALGNATSKVVSIEGCASISYFAQSTFDRMQLSNIELVIGNFNNVLPSTLSAIDQLDLVYIDGNHRKLPTLN